MPKCLPQYGYVMRFAPRTVFQTAQGYRPTEAMLYVLISRFLTVNTTANAPGGGYT